MSFTTNDTTNKKTDSETELIEVRKLEKLKEQIDTLDKNQHVKIFEIIKKYNLHYSTNINGIFVNITNINQQMYDEMNTFIQHVIEQEAILKNFETDKTTTYH